MGTIDGEEMEIDYSNSNLSSLKAYVLRGTIPSYFDERSSTASEVIEGVDNSKFISPKVASESLIIKGSSVTTSVVRSKYGADISFDHDIDNTLLVRKKTYLETTSEILTVHSSDLVYRFPQLVDVPMGDFTRLTLDEAEIVFNSSGHPFSLERCKELYVARNGSVIPITSFVQMKTEFWIYIPIHKKVVRRSGSSDYELDYDPSKDFIISDNVHMHFSKVQNGVKNLVLKYPANFNVTKFKVVLEEV